MQNFSSLIEAWPKLSGLTACFVWMGFIALMITLFLGWEGDNSQSSHRHQHTNMSVSAGLVRLGIGVSFENDDVDRLKNR
ncbi:MAG: hypothetical protein JWL59_3458 [Chthoniobacteraceae bacterium]|nr:hypothetical protein [Chthoniobacteraceae bacterium]